MVRAGVVTDPIDWEESCYYEVQNPRKRYQIIDYSSLSELLNVEARELQERQKTFIKDALERKSLERVGKWKKTIAVGNNEFVERIIKQPGVKAIGRKTVVND